ncbi:hypothetical protein R1sor_019043 [Riccia sorocarpa]|uniref:Transposase n=1 Tax=Riccia sorocarpa TaxID=122646 RepID=A0ABD3IFI5_9MARC
MAAEIFDAQSIDDFAQLDEPEFSVLLEKGFSSPVQPARKTRVVSMSKQKSPLGFLVSKSPVRIYRRRKFNLLVWSRSGPLGINQSVQLPDNDDNIMSLVFGSDTEHDSDWSVHSAGLDADDSDSDWEDFSEEICFEDLPRLGLVQPDESFEAHPIAWQLADEYWTSATTEYSHDINFLGSSTEPIHDWFIWPYFDDNSSGMHPIDFFNQLLPLNVARMVCRETNRYGQKKKGERWSALAVGEFRAWLGVSKPET